MFDRRTTALARSMVATLAVAIAMIPSAKLCTADDVLETGKQSVAQEFNGLPLVFHEDFESGVDRWETTDDAAWTLRATESPIGVATASSKSSTPSAETKNHVWGLNRRKSDYTPEVRSPHNIALIKEVELEDFVLFFDVKSTKDTGGHRDCCVFFGHQDPQHFYYAHLGARPDPQSGQILIVNGVPRKAMTDNQREVPWDDEWHAVKLVRDSKSGAIEVYFDDMKEPQMQFQDRTFGKGRIGIGSFDDMNDFDNVRLYGR